MCLIISIIFAALAYTFFQDGNMQGFYINISIALFFILLMARNILKTKSIKDNERKN
jgi:predicted Na+-dependent transporter